MSNYTYEKHMIKSMSIYDSKEKKHERKLMRIRKKEQDTLYLHNKHMDSLFEILRTETEAAQRIQRAYRKYRYVAFSLIHR